MTLHCAVMYFNAEKPAGYLLGCDSLAGYEEEINGKPTGRIIQFYTDKSFLGKNSIGFLRGTIDGGDNPEKAFSEHMQGLEAVFDNIHKGANYSGIPVLGTSEKYVLMVGKQSSSAVELYTISNTRMFGNHKARKLHSIKLDGFRKEHHSMMWFAPRDKNYFVFSTKEKLDKNKAQELLENFLTMPTPELREALGVEEDYNPGTPNMYDVSFGGIEKIVSAVK